MKTFNENLNYRALETAVKSIFGADGLKRVIDGYHLTNNAMIEAFNAGKDKGSEEAFTAGKAEAEIADAAKITELRRVEFERGVQAGKDQFRSAMVLDATKWVEASPTYESVLAAMQGSPKAIADEFELQRDSGDETSPY